MGQAARNPDRPARSISGWWVAAAWAASAVACYVGPGGRMAWSFEGMDPAGLSPVPFYLAVFAVCVAAVLTAVWTLWPIFAGRGALPEALPGASARRRFLVGVGAGVGGFVASAAAVVVRNYGWLTVTRPAIRVHAPHKADLPRPKWKGARIEQYRRLGRTGFEVSDISLGSSGIQGPAGERVARAAIERGINYFDTSPDYAANGSEKVLGRAMRGHREKMFVATKFCTAHGNLPAGTPVEDYMRAVEGSLERLETDYVDLVHIHSCASVERLMDPNVHEAFDRLRAQGKARYLGFSSHSPNLELVAAEAIASRRFDVMMLAYHHGAFPKLPELIDRAHAIDMGVVAMKTLKGARHRGLLEDRDQRDSYTQAAFKWVLGNPNVSCLVVSFRQLAHIDEYIYASGKAATSGDHAVLKEYDRQSAGKHCYQHCGACLDACPAGLPIDDVLRLRMYFEDYGQQREAMRQYASLDLRADVCSGCAAPCAEACPFGVPIPEYTQGAHRMLTADFAAQEPERSSGRSGATG